MTNAVLKITDAWFGFYGANANRKLALLAIKSLKDGNIDHARAQLDFLGIKTDEKLTIITDEYKPSPRIVRAASAA